VKLQIRYHHVPQLANSSLETTVRSPHSIAGVAGEPRSLKVRFKAVRGKSVDIDVTFGSGQVMLDRKGAGQEGCGGFCGSITYGNIAEPLRRGYAVAATDDGHEAGGTDASWTVGHRQKVIGYRALKETTDVAKDVIMAFKANSARRSYFMGCSDGGREALMEAQRYPQDFDGTWPDHPQIIGPNC